MLVGKPCKVRFATIRGTQDANILSLFNKTQGGQALRNAVWLVLTYPGVLAGIDLTRCPDDVCGTKAVVYGFGHLVLELRRNQSGEKIQLIHVQVAR